jgi:hypothetical protein
MSRARCGGASRARTERANDSNKSWVASERGDRLARRARIAGRVDDLKIDARVLCRERRGLGELLADGAKIT